MYLKEGQNKIFIINFLLVIVFSIIYFLDKNYEFMIYVGVIIFFFALILLTNKIVNFPNIVMWLLSLWAFLHMAGGGLYYNGTRWYDLMLINIVGAPYQILKYDQVIHFIGFFSATVAVFYLLKPLLKSHDRWWSLGLVVVMAGLGLGALNEIIEFCVTLLFPSTGVGGYINTSLDLVFNLAGAIFAMFLVYYNETKNKIPRRRIKKKR